MIHHLPVAPALTLLVEELLPGSCWRRSAILPPAVRLHQRVGRWHFSRRNNLTELHILPQSGGRQAVKYDVVLPKSSLVLGKSCLRVGRMAWWPGPTARCQSLQLSAAYTGGQLLERTTNTFEFSHLEFPPEVPRAYLLSRGITYRDTYIILTASLSVKLLLFNPTEQFTCLPQYSGTFYTPTQQRKTAQINS